MHKPGLKKLPFDSQEAVRLITLIIGLTLLAFGLYMFSPWYVSVPGGAAFAEVPSISQAYFKLVSLAYAAAGAGMAYAGVKGQSLYTRILTVIGVSMFSIMVITRLITIGIIPTIWLFQLALLLISAVLALTETGDR